MTCKPPTYKLNTLALWLDFSGWAGGTIHAALDAFETLPKSEQDVFCGRIMRSLDAGALSDVETALHFTRARIGLR